MTETRASADRLGMFSGAVIAAIITIMVLSVLKPSTDNWKQSVR
jgi:uncharacterized membrane protein